MKGLMEVLNVRLINIGNLIAEAVFRYDELEIHGVTIFQNGKKGLQVVWPRQRPKPGYPKWTPIVVLSEQVRREAEPMILKAVREAIEAAA